MNTRFRIKHLFTLMAGLVFLVNLSFSRQPLVSESEQLLKAHDTLTKKMSDKEKSLAAFATIAKVLKNPRCMNCHPSDDRPRQGDDRHKHLFGVQRGKDNHGLAVQRCATCHHEENNPYTNVPGAPHWGLAPKSMGWMGLTDVELGKALVDKEKNGGRTPKDLVKHMSKDKLVLWAWNPGKGRSLPPVSLPNFKKALNQWLENGAHVPEK